MKLEKLIPLSACIFLANCGGEEPDSTGTTSPAPVYVIQEGRMGYCYADGIATETNNPGFSGDGYTNTTNFKGARIIWAVDASTSARYQLKLRVANGGKSNRGGELRVNNGSNGVHTMDIPATGAWSTWQDIVLDVDLAQGNNIVEIAANTWDGLANVDSLTIIGDGSQGGDCSEVDTESSSNSENTGTIIGDGRLLPQDGNPAQKRFQSSRNKWSADKADVVLSHQFDNGGWPKNEDYDLEGSGGTGEGTFDNGATVTEIVYLAQIYQDTGNTKYAEAVKKAMNFILEAQYPSGGWPQYFPLRDGYWSHVTFNDNAMASILTMLSNANQENTPFNGNLFNDEDRNRMRSAINLGINYILKSQWSQNGVLTVWCAQHGASDYLPKAGRAYELESLSGSESVGILGFLMTQPQTLEVETAVKAGIAWFRNPETILKNYSYNRSTPEKIVPQQGSRMWYRFYDLETNQGFFSDRDGGKYFDIIDISEERREGYVWGGAYGENIINYARSVGY